MEKNQIKIILVIEDEPGIRNFASQVLQLEGYHVLQAEDGDKGLRLARQNRIALVLLDLKLPYLNGWAVLSQIKSDPELSAIPVVIFTASAAEPQQNRALAAGAADYLVKPLSAVSLKNTVARILHLKKKR